jgi:hypothetical protein
LREAQFDGKGINRSGCDGDAIHIYRLKARGDHRDVIGAERQISEVKVAGAGSYGVVKSRRRNFGGGDMRLGDDGSRGIGDGAVDAASERLREQRHRKKR